jgi:hypothetical protein
MRGCATARTKKNVIAQIDTEQGIAGKTDPKSRRGFLSVCFPPGATAPIVTTVPATAGAAATGLGPFAKAFILGGAQAAVLLGFRGSNPSPSGP